MLTDVEGVYNDWGTSKQTLITRAAPADLRKQEFASGTMGPKFEAAAAFVDSDGKLAGIGRLERARAILEGRAGTLVTP